MERTTFQPASIKEATEGTGSVKEYFPNGNPMVAPAFGQNNITALYLSLTIAAGLAIAAVAIAIVAIRGRNK